MAAVNQNLDPMALQHVLANFSREMEKVSLAEESWNDVVDLFDGEGVDEEANEVVDQVLDELGIEIGQKLDQVSCPTNSVQEANYDEVCSATLLSSLTLPSWKNSLLLNLLPKDLRKLFRLFRCASCTDTPSRTLRFEE
jgi:hypothetical protein